MLNTKTDIFQGHLKVGDSKIIADIKIKDLENIKLHKERLERLTEAEDNYKMLLNITQAHIVLHLKLLENIIYGM